VTARRVNAHGSEASCKAASITLDTDLAGREDAFNPAELLLAALSACMLKGIERVAPMLEFELRSVEVRVRGVRQDVPPRMERIAYEIQVDTDEPDRRLELLHENVKKYGFRALISERHQGALPRAFSWRAAPPQLGWPRRVCASASQRHSAGDSSRSPNATQGGAAYEGTRLSRTR